MRILIIIIVLIIVGVAVFMMRSPASPEAERIPDNTTTNISMEKISFNTEDGVTIVGNYWKGNSERGIVLLHMMPATKESWNAFAQKLHERGWHVLAIDERGHGESTRQIVDGKEVVLDYEDFDDTQQQAKIKDVAAAVAWLEAQGVSSHEISLGGGSIGANLTLQYMAENGNVLEGFLLSPGLNYHSIETLPLAQETRNTQRIFIVGAKDDADEMGTAATQAQQIHDALTADGTLIIYDEGGHAENLFSAHSELMDRIIQWLEEA